MDQQAFLFGLEDKPPMWKSMIYGLQWMMLAIPNIAVFSVLCGAALNLDPGGVVGFSQRLLIATGVMTILQSLKGHRFPILEGPSSALLLSFIVLSPHGLSVIEGGMIFGGMILLAIGRFKWFERLSPLFTPNMVGVILMLVALTLVPIVAPMLIGVDKTHPDGSLGVCTASLSIIFFVALLSHWMGGFFQTISMLVGIAFGMLLFLAQGKISWSLVSESRWLAFPSPFWGQWPTFSVSSIVSISFAYLAVMVNTVGSIQGTSEVIGKEGLEDRIHRGIAMTGAGGLVCAVMGVVGLVAHSTSPGVVLITRVASRFVLTMSGLIMIMLAFIPKLWAVLTVIPPSVISAVLFVALASGFMAGVSAVTSNKTKIDRRDYFCVGLPLLLGILVSVLPKSFFHVFPEALAPLVGNGLVVGIIFTLLAEHLFFREGRVKRPRIVQ